MMDEFYGTAAGYTEYHTARGRDVSADAGSDIEAGLLVASEWIDAAYRSAFQGRRVGLRAVQTREWPRYDVYLGTYGGGYRGGYYGYDPVDYTTVPVEVERATYEVAMRWLQDKTVLTPDFTPQKYRRVSIDGALSVDYNMLDASSAQKQFPVVGDILAPLLGNAASVSSLSGSIVRA